MSQYEELKKLSLAPGVSDEVRFYATQQMQALEDENLAKQSASLAAPPAEEEPAAEAEPDIIGAVDPDLPVQPQHDAIVPAAVGPGAGPHGVDEDWLRRPDKDLGGPPVVFYEPPVEAVKKMLWENPEIVRSRFPDVAISPEQIEQLTPESDFYKAASDYLWNEAAGEAQKAGRTGYRYSKANWLHADAQGLSPLAALTMKAAYSIPVGLGAAASFVLGVDKAANLGVVAKAAEAMDPEQTGFKPDGTAFQQSTKEMNAQIQDEHPWMNLAGQAYGSFANWTPANKLGGFLAAPVARLGAGVKGIDGVAARLASGAAAGGVGAAGVQAAQELVDASGEVPRAAREGYPVSIGGSAPPELTLDPLAALKRIGYAGGVGTVAGGVGKAISMTSGGAAGAIREGEHFERAPAKLEAEGGKFTVTGGPVGPPEVEEIITRANANRFENVRDTHALDIEPQIMAGVAERKVAQKAMNKENVLTFNETPEGQLKIVGKHLGEETLKQMRRHRSKAGARGEVIATNPAALEDAKEVFNKHVVGGIQIKAKPGKDDIVLSPEEAESFLDEDWQGKFRKKLAMPEGEAAHERSHAGTEVVIPKGASLSAELHLRGIDHVVISPQRLNAAAGEDVLSSIDGFSKKGKRVPPEGYKEMDEAARRDRDKRPMRGPDGQFIAPIKNRRGEDVHGWSQHQNRVADEITQTERMEERVGAKGKDNQQVMRVIGQYGSGAQGSALQDKALREVAAQQGISKELERGPAVSALEELKGRARFFGGKGKTRGALARVYDPLALHSIPILDKLESGLGGGKLGRIGPAAARAIQKEQDAELTPADLRNLKVTDPRVQAYLKQRRESRR